jgi:hypothetical protein
MSNPPLGPSLFQNHIPPSLFIPLLSQLVITIFINYFQPYTIRTSATLNQYEILTPIKSPT